MSSAMHGYDAADPDRLAVFAVRSLVAMLDDSDEVSVIRLNGPAEGEAPLALASLERRRQRLEKLLDLTGPLAEYGGDNTPCEEALQTLGRLLDAAYQPGTSQVVFFLTDGDCTGSEVEGKRFLANLRSHRDNLFQLYLLRFAGRPYTEALVELAHASGGQAMDVAADDPTALLEPFADALTRSQGYEAQLITPDSRRLAAHQGARRVRLLVVAPGVGPPLGFSLEDVSGDRSLGSPGPVETGIHRFGTGETYRYAALDYRPGSGPVEVRVTGGGEDWKGVAVPEYRLSVHLEMRQGICSEDGPQRHSLASGDTLCAVLKVVDEHGRQLSGDTVHGLEAVLRVARRELGSRVVGTDGPWHAGAEEYRANPRGARAEFVYERPHLETGLWELEPCIRWTGESDAGRGCLPARRHTLRVATMQIAVEPPRIDFGALVPGQRAGERLVLTGNFPETQARLEMIDPASLPPCVAFTLGDTETGQAVPIRQGQAYSLGLDIAPYCSPESFDRRFEVALRLVFDSVAGKALPSQTVEVGFGLDSRLEHPQQLRFEIQAGEEQGVELSLVANAEQIQEFAVGLEMGPGWPTDLTLTPTVDAVEVSRFGLDPADGGGRRLGLQLQSTACCAAGEYTGELILHPLDSEGARLESTRPIRIPVRVLVRGVGPWAARTWACYGEVSKRTMLWLLVLLLLLYGLSMLRNSHFLSRRHLASSLTPLRWDTYGGFVRHARSKDDVQRLVERSLPPARRLWAWLRANPLVFGLPGRRYRETVELLLQPDRRVERSRLTLVPERDHLESLQGRPDAAVGRLFARATGGRGQTFYAVPKGDGRVGRLVPENRLDEYLFADEIEDGEEINGVVAKARVQRLERRQPLLYPISEHEREEGRAAGWQLG